MSRNGYHFHTCRVCGEEIGCSCPYPCRADVVCEECDEEETYEQKAKLAKSFIPKSGTNKCFIIKHPPDFFLFFLGGVGEPSI